MLKELIFILKMMRNIFTIWFDVSLFFSAALDEISKKISGITSRKIISPY